MGEQTDKTPDAPGDPAERQAIEALASQLDDLTAAKILSFGRNVEEEMASFADIAVDQALGNQEGALSSHLGEIRIAAQIPANIAPDRKPDLFGRLFGSPKREIERHTQQFFDARRQVDTVALHLQDYLHRIDHGLVVLDRMFEANAKKAIELTRFTEAGKLALAHHRAAADPAADGPDASVIAHQTESDRQSALDQLERRISDLDRSRIVTLGMLATLRQTQSIGQALVEQIQKTLDQAIPAWKTSMLIRIQQLRQRHGLEALDTLGDLGRSDGAALGAGNAESSQQSLLAALDKIEQLENDALAARADGPLDAKEVDLADIRSSIG